MDCKDLILRENKSDTKGNTYVLIIDDCLSNNKVNLAERQRKRSEMALFLKSMRHYSI